MKSLSAPGLGAGLILLCISFVIAGFARWRTDLLPDERLTANMLALVSWWVGSFVLCFGARVSRALLFPLGFLLLVVPLPRFLVNGIVAWLQQASAFTAHYMFSIARVPVTQEGVLLDIPGLTVEGRQGVQQHPFELHVADNNHDSGAAPAAHVVAKMAGNRSGHSCFRCQEWSSHFYDCNAWDACRSVVFDRKTSSPGGNRLFFYWPRLHVLCIVDLAPE